MENFMLGMDLKKHFSLTSSAFVSEICNELLANLGVTYFNYLKIYKDGSRDLLTNNPKWIEHFYKNALYHSSGALDIEYFLPKGYFLWSELNNDDPIYAQGRENFNIDNGLSFVVKQKDATILYIFASTRENHIINNFYARNIDLFKRFILYFNDKGSDLIKEAEKNRIILPDNQLVSNKKEKPLYFSEKNRIDFFKKTEIERFFISEQDESVYLTKREAECVAYMLYGSTAKQTAKNLNISYRTVESYINQAKEKLKLSTKEELIEFLYGSGVHDVIIDWQGK